MYHKVIVMEIKEKYALVMAEDGQILRVLYKNGMKVGDCIYILEDDILKKEDFQEESPVKVISFADKKNARNKQKTVWKKMVAVVAASALFVTSLAVLSKPEKAYAMVSVDGEKTVEVVLNQKNRVKEADSRNSSFTKKEENAMKGEKVEIIKNYFSQDLLRSETIIVGYAFLEDESEEERAALQRRLEKTFGTDHLLYLVGDKEDVENAQKADKSLGVYLAEQILTEENFQKVVNEATKDEVLNLLEKNPSFKEDPAWKEMIQQKQSDYENTEEFEKEEETEHGEEKNEDAFEKQEEIEPTEEVDSYEEESIDTQEEQEESVDDQEDREEDTETPENSSEQAEE